MLRETTLVLAALVFVACHGAPEATAPASRSVARRSADEIETTTLAAEGMSSDEFVKLTKWIRDNPYPIFSLLVSRNGKIVYELYTGSIERDDAHYQMSVTKSVLSVLIGIAIDRKLINGPDAPLVDMLPAKLFVNAADRERLAPLTLQKVMGMSALDAPDPPRKTDAEATARYQRFWNAKNRLTVALQEPLLQEPFQYNDSTPTLAVGALQYSTGKSALEFAEEALFAPMGFRNYEWMHQDPAGLDNAGYGLRLRPIDMQKLGILMLHHGEYRGKQLVSRAWVERSFRAWNKSKPELAAPDYGWFWWQRNYGPGFDAHVAVGWKGQRIAVIPEQNLVVTMTAAVEDGSEEEFLSSLIQKVVAPSVAHGAGAVSAELPRLIEKVKRAPPRFADFIQYRMVPSQAKKQMHRAFSP